MDLILPFKVGDAIESRSFSVGYRGAWFRCKLSDMCTRYGHLECQLEYMDYPDEKKSWTRLFKVPQKCRNQKGSQSREIMVRPPFPQWYWENHIPEHGPWTDVVAIASGPWKVGDLIDWWYTGCFWTGKIVELLGNDRAQIVCPEIPLGEGGCYDVEQKDLRPALDWSLEKGWSVPLSQGQSMAELAPQVLAAVGKCIAKSWTVAQVPLHSRWIQDLCGALSVQGTVKFPHLAHLIQAVQLTLPGGRDDCALDDMMLVLQGAQPAVLKVTDAIQSDTEMWMVAGAKELRRQLWRARPPDVNKQENGNCWYAVRLITQNPTGSSSSDEGTEQSDDGKDEVQKCLNGASHMPDEAVDSHVKPPANTSDKCCMNNRKDGEEPKCMTEASGSSSSHEGTEQSDDGKDEVQKCLNGASHMPDEAVDSHVKPPANTSDKCCMNNRIDGEEPKCMTEASGSSSSDEGTEQSDDGKDEVQKCLNGASHMPDEAVDSHVKPPANTSDKCCMNNRIDGEEQKCMTEASGTSLVVIDSKEKHAPDENGECCTNRQADSPTCSMDNSRQSAQFVTDGQSSPTCFKKRKTSTDDASVELPDTVCEATMELEKLANKIRCAQDLLLSTGCAPQSTAPAPSWKLLGNNVPAQHE